MADSVVDKSDECNHQKRAWKPKVRTGCLVCKRRRVKCDEGKPSCMQCLRLGHKCEGYETQSDRTKDHLKQRAQARPALLPNKPNGLQLSPNPRALSFIDDQEASCFQYFTSTASSLLSGPFRSSLWTYLIPQACMQSRTVRHAAIAVAALSLVSEVTQRYEGRTIDARRIAYTEQLSIFALSQYNKALKQSRSSYSESIDIVLLTCLLIISFETFSGNDASALSQLQAGISLINGSFGDDKTENTENPQHKTVTTVEREILEEFSRLDVHVLMLLKSRPLVEHISMKYRILQESQSPDAFGVLKDARREWSMVQRRLLRLFEMTSEEKTGQMSSFLNTFDRNAFRSCYKERETMLDELFQWNLAFDPLFQRITADDDDYCAALTLKLQYLTGYIYLVSVRTNHTTPERNFVPIYAELLSLARLIIQHPQTKQRRYMIEVQTIKPLYAVACHCVYRPLRRQAIELLKSASWREGFWDSAVSAQVAEWIMNVEEEGLQGDYIPDEARIFDINIHVDLHKRTADAFCKKKDTSFLEQYRAYRTILTW